MTDLAELEAFVAISQLKARYCRTLDAGDWDAFAELFTEDLVLEVPGAEPVRGRDNAIGFIRSALENATTAHHVHPPEIDLRGDEAHVIFAMQDRNTWGEPGKGGRVQRGYGQYHERYVRAGGQWKIAHQKLVYLHLDYDH